MPKYTTLFAALLLTLGAALAQEVTLEPETGPEETQWAAVSLGSPLGFSFHYGLEEFLSPDLDVRFNAAITFQSGFGLGADALYELPVETGEVLSLYAGAGPYLVFGAGSEFGVRLFGGAEYRLTNIGFDPGGVFFEIGPTLRIVPAFEPVANARLGFNYHF